MTDNAIAAQIQRAICAKIRIEPEGIDRYRIFTPFRFNDGDHYKLVLKKHEGGWVMSDEAHTFMRLSYDFDDRELKTGTREKIIKNTISSWAIEEDDGELFVPIRDANYGDAIFSLVQAVGQISDLTFLSRDNARSTFVEDVATLIDQFAKHLPPSMSLVKGWTHPDLDPEKAYKVDYLINGGQKPVAIFALSSNANVDQATIALTTFENWKFNVHSIGLFEDLEKISQKRLVQISNVIEKQFPYVRSNEERISSYLKRDLIPAPSCSVG